MKKIFCDMDGVISDFTAGWCKAFGVEFSNENYSFPIGLWDYTKWMEQNLGITWDQVADICSDEGYWQNLPLLPNAIEFYSTLRIGVELVFLTTPTGDFYSNLAGKRRWLDKYGFKENMIVTSDSKGQYAASDTILIDDKDKNVQDFIKAGGRAILIPRPWNNRHFEFKSFKQANNLVIENLEACYGYDVR